MAKPGPPRVPTALKILSGNPGKKRLPENEPQIVSGLPEPPPELCERAVEEWNARGPYLVRLRVLSPADVSAFASYCQAYADWRDAREGLQKLKAALPEGEKSGAFLVRTVEGGWKKNPLMAIARDLGLDALRYACELGLTPAARARVEVLAPEEEKESTLKGLLYAENRSKAK